MSRNVFKVSVVLVSTSFTFC